MSQPNLILSSLVLNSIFQSLSLNVQIIELYRWPLDFFINWVIIYVFSKSVYALVRKYYKPSFFNKDRLTIKDVIEINTGPSVSSQSLLNQEEYIVKKEFELNQRSFVFSYLFISFIIILVSYLSLFISDNVIVIDYVLFFRSLLYMAGYVTILSFMYQSIYALSIGKKLYKDWLFYTHLVVFSFFVFVILQTLNW